MTKEEALEHACRMYEQKIDWPVIADYLFKQGYKSPQTKRPLSWQGVRYMVLSRIEKEHREDKALEATFTGTPALDKLEAIRKVIKIREVDSRTRESLIEAILN